MNVEYGRGKNKKCITLPKILELDKITKKNLLKIAEILRKCID
jgi:hypothetical protein